MRNTVRNVEEDRNQMERHTVVVRQRRRGRGNVGTAATENRI